MLNAVMTIWKQVMTEEYEGLTVNLHRNEGTDSAFKSNLSN